jgi:hypothetical protein
MVYYTTFEKYVSYIVTVNFIDRESRVIIEFHQPAASQTKTLSVVSPRHERNSKGKLYGW